MRYFDSGVLLKLYLSEPNPAQAVAFVQEQGGLPPITALHRLEMKAAFGQVKDLAAPFSPGRKLRASLLPER